MKTSCCVALAVYAVPAAVLTGVFFVRFPGSPDLPPLVVRAGLAAAGGLIAGVPAFLALMFADGVRQHLARRRRLRAGVRETPVDGAIQPLAGRLVARGSTLRAPLSGRDCLVYHYRAFHGSGGSRPGTVTDAEGYALAPSALETASGPIDIRACLRIGGAVERIEPELARPRLGAHLAAVGAAGVSHDVLADRRAADALVGADGAMRFDRARDAAPAHALTFTERTIGHGEEVVVTGWFSAAAGAVVPDPRHDFDESATVRRGSAAGLARRMAAEAAAGSAMALAFAGATAVAVRAFFRVVPTLL